MRGFLSFWLGYVWGFVGFYGVLEMVCDSVMVVVVWVCVFLCVSYISVRLVREF